MTLDDRSLERAARTWIEAGPTQAPDRAVEAALVRIQTTPQERDLRIPWRFPPMFSNRLTIAAVVVVVLVAGLFGVTKLASVGQTGPSPTPGSSVLPTAAPSPSELNPAAGYPTLQGWIVFEHFGLKPDGTTTTFDDNYHAIWLVHADGSGLHELAPGKPADGKQSPDISPDGTKIVFMSSTDASHLYEVPIDGTEPRELSPCKGASGCAAADPTYSPDGSRVAFVLVELSSKSPTAVIGILDLARSTTIVLERTRIDLALGDLAQPSWSPDGTRIVYARELQKQTDPHITDSRLFVAHVDGSAIDELPQPEGAWAADADWSPDGSTIVFSSLPNRETGWGAGAPTPHIYTIKPDGTGVTQVCAGCLQGGVDPTWTPDGKHIMFWGFRSWALMNPDGSQAAHINQPKLTWFGSRLGYGYAAFLQPTP
jgi:TolB protein